MKRMVVLGLLWLAPSLGSAGAPQAPAAQANVPNASPAPGAPGPPALPTATTVPPPVTLDLGGGYQGVAPGSPNLPPKPSAVQGDGRARITWPGFLVRSGVPTVFVQVTRAVAWKVIEGPDELVVLIYSASVPLRNNLRSLKIEHFGTPVREMVLKQRGRDVALVIRLRSKVAHREHLEDSSGGFKLLVIELV